MPENPTIVATWGRAIANAIESYDCDSQPLFDELGLDIQLSYDPNAHYPIPGIYKLLRRAVEVTGDDAFGLKVSRFLPNTFAPVLGMLVAHSDNMLRGFEALGRFFRTINDVFELELEREGDRVFLHCRPAVGVGRPPSVDAHQYISAEAVDATFAGLVYNVRNALDPNFRVSRVFFVRPEPDNVEAFDALFQAPILYGQEQDKLEFDYQVLTTPLATANPELARVNEQILQHLMESVDENAFITDVQLHILNQLRYEEPSQEDIAELLHLSARQLRRKLQQSGTSYAQLLQLTRHQLAQRYLLQPGLNVSDVAQLVGFNDQSNFSKAFRRWEGVSPASYRKRELAG